MRLAYAFLFLTIGPSVVLSQSADSTVRTQVRPGIMHTTYVLDGPVTADVITVDLSDPRYSLESYRPDSLTRTSEQVRRAEESGVEVIAAVNADFFSFETHWPVGNQVASGVPVTGLRSRRSHVSVSMDGKVRFGPASFSGSVVHQRDSLSLDGLNAYDDSGRAFLYNAYWGKTTRTPAGMTDHTLRMIGGSWVPGDTLVCIVTMVGDEGNTAIGPGEAVLSVKDGVWLLDTGDTVRITVRYGNHTGRIRTMLGGAGRILEDGRYPTDGNREAEGIGLRFITDRHPRTFVAIDKDTSTLFLCTVDGRQTSSVGMNFPEMSRFLTSIGAWNAVNLDGGGSTTMVIGGTVVNSPSDKTGERPVANILMVTAVRGEH